MSQIAFQDDRITYSFSSIGVHVKNTKQLHGASSMGTACRTVFVPFSKQPTNQFNFLVYIETKNNNIRTIKQSLNQIKQHPVDCDTTNTH